MSPNASRNIAPRSKLWFEVDGEYVFGLGICRMLEAVQQTGSIKAAAQQIGKSYRHVWSRIKEVEQALGVPLVTTRVGGADHRRSELTPAAQSLTAAYQQLRGRVVELIQDEFRSVASEFAAACAKSDQPLADQGECRE